MHIDYHSDDEKYGSDDELRGPKPTYRILVDRGKTEKPSPLHEGVAGIEKETGGNDRDRHFAGTTHKHGKYEGALQVMQLKKNKN